MRARPALTARAPAPGCRRRARAPRAPPARASRAARRGTPSCACAAPPAARCPASVTATRLERPSYRSAVRSISPSSSSRASTRVAVGRWIRSRRGELARRQRPVPLDRRQRGGQRRRQLGRRPPAAAAARRARSCAADGRRDPAASRKSFAQLISLANHLTSAWSAPAEPARVPGRVGDRRGERDLDAPVAERLRDAAAGLQADRLRPAGLQARACAGDGGLEAGATSRALRGSWRRPWP